MCQILNRSRLSNRLYLLVLFIFIVSLNGCALMKKVEVKPSPIRTYPEEKIPEEKIEKNDFSVAKGEDVIGRLAVTRLENARSILSDKFVRDSYAYLFRQGIDRAQASPVKKNNPINAKMPFGIQAATQGGSAPL